MAFLSMPRFGLIGLLLLSASSVFAFEPVPIDEFFKNNPQERGQQQDFSQPAGNASFAGVPVYNDGHVDSAIRKTEPVVRGSALPLSASVQLVRTQDYGKLSLLVLNRISEEVHHLTFKKDEMRKQGIFTIHFKNCTEKLFSDNSVITTVSWAVIEETKKLDANGGVQTENQQVYDNQMILQHYGVNGFEHSTYDIRPLACVAPIGEAKIEDAFADKSKEIKEIQKMTPSQEDPIKKILEGQ